MWRTVAGSPRCLGKDLQTHLNKINKYKSIPAEVCPKLPNRGSFKGKGWGYRLLFIVFFFILKASLHFLCNLIYKIFLPKWFPYNLVNKPLCERNHSRRAGHIILPNVIFHVQVPQEDQLSVEGKNRSTACGYGDSPYYPNRFSAPKIKIWHQVFKIQQ